MDWRSLQSQNLAVKTENNKSLFHTNATMINRIEVSMYTGVPPT